MHESGKLRGDEVLHSHGKPERPPSGDPVPLDEILDSRWSMDLSEENREGDEMSGDEHSSGLEGGEQEIEGQSHIRTGMPGDQTCHEDEDSLPIRKSRQD